MDAFLLSIAATGFTVAFLHAAIPTHWLPFVLAARAQRWDTGRAMPVTALAGSGHVLFTTVLGILVVWAGIRLNGLVGGVFPFVAGGALIAFGLFYLLRAAFGASRGHAHGHHGHGHGHHEHGHDEQSNDDAEPGQAPTRHVSDRAAVVSLFTLLAFSPCEGFLPVYFSGVRYGWAGFALLSVILAAATLAGMVLFTWLTLHGMRRLRLQALERYESEILGAVLVLLGAAVMVFEQ